MPSQQKKNPLVVAEYAFAKIMHAILFYVDICPLLA